MSVTTDFQTIPPGSTRLVDTVWELKETIRDETGFLRQEHDFFYDMYRQSTTHVVLENQSVVGFISIQDNGYILFLGVDPASQGHGYGRDLVEYAADDYPALTCHARTTNSQALSFYETLDFERSHTIEGYYSDGGDADYLVRRGESPEATWEQWTS